MTEPQSALSREALRIKKELQQYFVHTPIQCPYGMPYEAVYNQAFFDTMPDFLMEVYLASGYRRNGNVFYNMHCGECKACVPIRIDPLLFKPNRSQKRTWNRNQDVTAEITALTCSRQNLDLLEKFLAERYPGHDSTALDYYNGFFLNHLTNTFEVSYKIGEKLLGVAIVDFSISWMNIVFFYFDPEESKRSPGTYNILFLLDFCRQETIQFAYLGYWIENVRQMSYKANFKPHQILQRGTWIQVKG